MSRDGADLGKNEISIVERRGMDLDQHVEITQGGNLDGFVELQAIEAVPAFDFPLLDCLRRHCTTVAVLLLGCF